MRTRRGSRRPNALKLASLSFSKLRLLRLLRSAARHASLSGTHGDMPNISKYFSLRFFCFGSISSRTPQALPVRLRELYGNRQACAVQ